MMFTMNLYICTVECATPTHTELGNHLYTYLPFCSVVDTVTRTWMPGLAVMMNASNGLFPSNPGLHCRNTHVGPTSATITITGGSGIPAIPIHHNSHRCGMCTWQ